MDPLKTQILEVAKKLISVPTKNREQICALAGNPEFLKKNGNRLLHTLQTFEKRETKLLEKILAKNPHFFRDVLRDATQKTSTKNQEIESHDHSQELADLENFWEKSWTELKI
ncbi:hypothetical protein HN954_00815 [bacterium]|jgi:hypothetical protein|nr:hypothetical protein [bacterium]MBT6831576.1 hypothetical protein [bacterium]MBT6995955.1 hypothetical protein [bacterium]MBT7772270.1 hypothetical protein [bacterium]